MLRYKGADTAHVANVHLHRHGQTCRRWNCQFVCAACAGTVKVRQVILQNTVDCLMVRMSQGCCGTKEQTLPMSPTCTCTRPTANQEGDIVRVCVQHTVPALQEQRPKQDSSIHLHAAGQWCGCQRRDDSAMRTHVSRHPTSYVLMQHACMVLMSRCKHRLPALPPLPASGCLQHSTTATCHQHTHQPANRCSTAPVTLPHFTTHVICRTHFTRYIM
jgi:hypothetical protein